MEATPFFTTSAHNLLTGVFILAGDHKGDLVLGVLILGVLRTGSAVLLIAAGNFGVADFPWIARRATAFLTSAGGEIIFARALFLGVGVFARFGVAALGESLGVVDFLGDGDFLGVSSNTARCTGDAMECLPVKPFFDTSFPVFGIDWRRGVAPRLSGVAGGKHLSKSSGLIFGPKETRLRLALGSSVIVRDLRFRPGSKKTSYKIIESYRN